MARRGPDRPAPPGFGKHGLRRHLGVHLVTERLTRLGKVGSEELSDILDSTFTALLEQARRRTLTWSSGRRRRPPALPRCGPRGAGGPRDRRDAARALPVGRTGSSAGKVTLRMSTGIHSGDFDFFLVGDPAVHRELIVSGPAASRTAELEGAATAGQIAVSPQTAADLPRSAVEQNDDGLLLVRRTPGGREGAARGMMQAPARPSPSREPGIAVLLPPPVRTHLLQPPARPSTARSPSPSSSSPARTTSSRAKAPRPWQPLSTKSCATSSLRASPREDLPRERHQHGRWQDHARRRCAARR